MIEGIYVISDSAGVRRTSLCYDPETDILTRRLTFDGGLIFPMFIYFDILEARAHYEEDPETDLLTIILCVLEMKDVDIILCVQAALDIPEGEKMLVIGLFLGNLYLCSFGREQLSLTIEQMTELNENSIFAHIWKKLRI